MVVHARMTLQNKNLKAAEKFADILKNLGLKIGSISPKAVGFEGEKSQLEQVFKADIQSDRSGHEFRSEPKMPFKSEEKVSVYFPSEVKYF